MAKIPSDLRLKTEIEIEDKMIKNDLRSYLGLSGIGDKCNRKLWYAFRLCAQEELGARNVRLLSRGHREEPIVIADLEAIGINIISKQETYICGQGHIKGHSDGVVGNVPDAPKTDHLLEIKTANDKNFKKLKKVGLREFSQSYYGQICTYMYLGKLKRTLYIVVNKNDDSRIYWRFESDNAHAKELIKKGMDIISTEVPPAKIGGPTWYECKWCKFYDICHMGAEPLKTCRTCTYCDICDDGVWECSRFSNLELTFDQQLKACRRYAIMNILKK